MALQNAAPGKIEERIHTLYRWDAAEEVTLGRALADEVRVSAAPKESLAPVTGSQSKGPLARGPRRSIVARGAG
jgi:hypothetical protein